MYWTVVSTGDGNAHVSASHSARTVSRRCDNASRYGRGERGAREVLVGAGGKARRILVGAEEGAGGGEGVERFRRHRCHRTPVD